MRLVDLQPALEACGLDVELRGAANVHIDDVRRDSREVRRGTLFAALPGERRDGANFVSMAAERGASAVLLHPAHADETDLPQVLTSDPRKAMAYAAHAVHGHPTHSLKVVGVTGTNGKTSVSFLIDALLRAAGEQTALLGTVAQRILEEERPTFFTTPESDDLARFAAEAQERGARVMVMEVSSHGLALHRVAGVRFDVAAFTNLTQDHLDFHPSMEAYGETKASLFLPDLALHQADLPQRSIVNVDDRFGASLAARIERAGRTVLRVSTVGTDADFIAEDATLSADGFVALVRTPRGDVRVNSPLIGAHNLSNLVVALACVHALDVDEESWVRACAALSSKAVTTPGRMERADGPEGVTVLVDYAHTPDALKNAIGAVAAVTTGRVIVVFGCGGDRDATKRGPMGAAAAAADGVIATSDNPRTEDPDAILDAVVEGLRAAGRDLQEDDARFTLRITDRREAIHASLRAASPGDTVLIAGKGHETYQIVGEERRPFDDREVVAEWTRSAS